MKYYIFLFLALFFSSALTAQVLRADELRMKSGGTITQGGYTIHGFSNDPTLGDSSTLELVTEAAVKAFAGAKGRVDSLVLVQDSILVAYNSAGGEVWRDTIAGTGGSGALAGTPSVTLENYDSLMAYTGSATVLFVKDFTSTAGWTVKGGTFYRVTNFIGQTFSQAVDYGTRFLDGSSRKWQRDFDGRTFLPEFWRVDSTLAYAGTLGWYADGSEAMNVLCGSAINYYIYQATGRRKGGIKIVLQGNKTYQSTVPVNMPIGVTIEGNGARINRKKPEIAIISANVTAGGTTAAITGGGNKFRPGMVVSVKRSSDPNGGISELENTGFFTVASASPTLITISGGTWARAATAPDTLYSGNHNIFQPGVSQANTDNYGGWDISGLSFDGNYQENKYTKSWLTGVNIYCPQTQNNIIERCHFEYNPGENIYICGGDVKNCTYKKLMGSFTHLTCTDTFSLVISNISGDSACMAGALSGHAGAAFETSVGARNTTIRDCHVTNGITNVIGAYTADDANIYVDNVTAKNFAGIHSGNGTLRSFSLINSKMVNCGDLIVKASDVADTVANVVIKNNIFVNTRIAFTGANNLKFEGNTLSWRPGTFDGYTAGVENALYKAAIADINMRGNRSYKDNFIYGDPVYNVEIADVFYFSISTSNTNGRIKYNGILNVKDNQFFNFKTLIANSLSSDYQYEGWTFDGNEIWSSPDSSLYVGTAYAARGLRGQIWKNNLFVNQSNTPGAMYFFSGLGILSTSADSTSLLGVQLYNNRFEGKNCTFIAGSSSWPVNVVAIGNVIGTAPIVNARSVALNNTVLNSGILSAYTSQQPRRPSYIRPVEPDIFPIKFE